MYGRCILFIFTFCHLGLVVELVWVCEMNLFCVGTADWGQETLNPSDVVSPIGSHTLRLEFISMPVTGNACFYFYYYFFIYIIFLSFFIYTSVCMFFCVWSDIHVRDDASTLKRMWAISNQRCRGLGPERLPHTRT